MNGKLHQIGFYRIPIIIKVTAPPNHVKKKICQPKHHMISDRNGIAYFLIEQRNNF